MDAESAVLEATARVKHLGCVDYVPTYEAMRRYTDARGPATADELWVLEHPPVYTVGLAGRAEHLPRGSAIPLQRVDRGGQITYHGPGQAIVYTLVDLGRRGLTVRSLVRLIEHAVIDLLEDFRDPRGARSTCTPIQHSLRGR
jgi:lipoyl(octanoyl) transferase